jgi:uncharacterized LabA/DUF88 family protein
VVDPRRARRPRAPKSEVVADTAAASAPAEVSDDGAAPPAARGRRGRTPRESVAAREPAVAASEAPAEARAPSPRARAVPQKTGAAPDAIREVLAEMKQQSSRLEQLIRAEEEAVRRASGGGGAPPARVGVFVDAANVELACDRLRTRVKINWAKVLAMVTKNRVLVRAMAYSPVHDDPTVSIETQRFVEPFIDHGYKVVTKPLKRFQDGTIKANVDIELALDIVSMLDRLDVVCLVSGDGDFTQLVEFVQAKGVRCEVVSIGQATATNLRHAADEFIDLQGRINEVRA